MTVRSILLFTAAEAADAGQGAPTFAVSLAKAHGASVTVFAVALDVATPGVSADAAARAAAITSLAKQEGVECRVVSEHSHAVGIHEVVAEHARLHDLVIAGCAPGAIVGERQIAEHQLFDYKPAMPVLFSH